MATGESRLSRLGGLRRDMPLLAAASGVAALTLAALPLTLGFFKDELFFKAALERGWLVEVLAVAAAALTFAYIGRFWLGLFAGPLGARARPVPALLVAPVVVLALIAAAGGAIVEPFAQLAEDAAGVTHGAPVELAPAYHLDARAENVMALLAWALGVAMLAWPRARAAVAHAGARAGDRFGPRRIYGEALLGLNRLSDRLHDLEVRDLRTSLAAVMVPGGVITAVAFAATPTRGAYEVGGVGADELPMVALLALAVAAGVQAARDPGRLRPVLALSVLGFALAAVYAIAGAPDVALVAVVVETVLTLVFVGVFARLPRTRGDGSAGQRALRRDRRRNAIAGAVAGVAAFATIWAALSRPSAGPTVAAEHVRRTPEAHGGDTVTVILTDFRGFDTLVEITVLAVAVAGVVSLLRRGRPW